MGKTGAMRGAARAPWRRGFTMAELLMVIGIIALLAGMLMPAVNRARHLVKEKAVRLEIGQLEIAMQSYFTDWGAYPPDRTPGSSGDAPPNMESGQCLTWYLGRAFRTSNGYSRNGGPYEDFAPDRYIEYPSGSGRYIFMDLLRAPAGRSVHWYRFDNNDAEDGQDPTAGETNYNGNATNVYPTRVDMWSAGWDGVDRVSALNPTKTNLAGLDLGDDICNW